LLQTDISQNWDSSHGCVAHIGDRFWNTRFEYLLQAVLLQIKPFYKMMPCRPLIVTESSEDPSSF